MISNLVVFAYIFFLLFALGVLMKILLTKFSFIDESRYEDTPIDHYIITGFVFLTSLLGIISLFSKIGLAVHLVIFGLTFFGILVYRSHFFRLFDSYKLYVATNRSIFRGTLLVWPFVFLLLVYSASSILVYDTGLYHAQFIQWIQSYRVLPGLAWIHSRFAFNSHFHLSCAFFNFSFLDIRNSLGSSVIFYPLNSFFILMLSLRCFFNVARGFVTRNSFDIVLYGVVFILSYVFFGGIIQSPTPDITTAILIFYVFFIFIERYGDIQPKQSWVFHDIVLLSIVFVLPTFKLSGAVIMVIIPFLIFRKKLAIRNILLVMFLGLLILIPFFSRNVIMSGWLAYPLPHFDLFDFDWKIHKEDVQIDFDVVKAWARIPAETPSKVLAMKFSEWFPVWWKNLQGEAKTNFLLINILRLNLISPLLFGILYFIDRKEKGYNAYAIAYCVMFINILLWFMSAPDPRLATGYLFFNAAIILALIFKKLQKVLSPRILVVIIFFVVLWATEIPVKHQPYLLDEARRGEIIFFPKQLEVLLSFESVWNVQGKLVIKKPVNDDRCFNTKVPCAPYPNASILLRGNSIDDGFMYPR